MRVVASGHARFRYLRREWITSRLTRQGQRQIASSIAANRDLARVREEEVERREKKMGRAEHILSAQPTGLSQRRSVRYINGAQRRYDLGAAACLSMHN